MPPTPKSSRTWIFTINNPLNNDLPKTWTKVSYCVWQLEKGEQDTPHLQGTVKFDTMMRLSALKKIDATAHWEPCRSEGRCVNYCQKEETRIEGPWTLGTPPSQGKRTDLENVQHQLDAGAAMKDVYAANFEASAKYYRFFKEYARVTTQPRNFQTECIVYWGPTGTGKSRKCHDDYPDAYWLSQGKWFDDYDRHEVVVIDEFYGWLPFSFLFRLLDRYPMSVETKGGSVQFIAKLVLITSNSHPSEWYKDPKCSYAALERRLTINHMLGGLNAL